MKALISKNSNHSKDGKTHSRSNSLQGAFLGVSAQSNVCVVDSDEETNNLDDLDDFCYDNNNNDNKNIGVEKNHNSCSTATTFEDSMNTSSFFDLSSSSILAKHIAKYNNSSSLSSDGSSRFDHSFELQPRRTRRKGGRRQRSDGNTAAVVTTSTTPSSCSNDAAGGDFDESSNNNILHLNNNDDNHDQRQHAFNGHGSSDSLSIHDITSSNPTRQGRSTHRRSILAGIKVIVRETRRSCSRGPDSRQRSKSPAASIIRRDNKKLSSNNSVCSNDTTKSKKKKEKIKVNSSSTSSSVVSTKTTTTTTTNRSSSGKIAVRATKLKSNKLLSSSSSLQSLSFLQSQPSTKNFHPLQNYLDNLVEKRGHSIKRFNTLETAYFNKATPMQQASFTPYIMQLLRENKIDTIDQLLASGGMSPNPCNQFGESLLHVLCRRNNNSNNTQCNMIDLDSIDDIDSIVALDDASANTFNLLSTFIKHKSSVQVSDDFGRTPLHELCWATHNNNTHNTNYNNYSCNVSSHGSTCSSSSTTLFEVSYFFKMVKLFLDQDVRMLFLVDADNMTPLMHVRQEHWNDWIEFFSTHKHHYWRQRYPEIDGVQVDPPLTRKRPHSQPIVDPENALPLAIVQDLCNGKITPSEGLAMVADIAQSSSISSAHDTCDGDSRSLETGSLGKNDSNHSGDTKEASLPSKANDELLSSTSHHRHFMAELSDMRALILDKDVPWSRSIRSFK